MKLIEVYELNYDELYPKMVFKGEREACMNFIGHEAKEKNCGIYRSWFEDGLYYYDCGPVVYFSKRKLEAEV